LFFSSSLRSLLLFPQPSPLCFCSIADLAWRSAVACASPWRRVPSSPVPAVCMSAHVAGWRPWRRPTKQTKAGHAQTDNKGGDADITDRCIEPQLPFTRSWASLHCRAVLLPSAPPSKWKASHSRAVHPAKAHSHAARTRTGRHTQRHSQDQNGGSEMCRSLLSVRSVRSVAVRLSPIVVPRFGSRHLQTHGATAVALVAMLNSIRLVFYYSGTHIAALSSRAPHPPGPQ
jgi:hypothetical protein